MTSEQRRLAVALFAVAWGTNISTPLLLLYQDRLDLSNSAAVAIFSVYVGGILLALLFAGRLSDRLGRRPLVLPCTVLSAVGSLVLIVGRDSLAVLLGGRFLLGAVSGAMLSVSSAWMNELAAERTPASRAHLATFTTTLLYLGFGFGPVTSAVYESIGPWPLVVPYVLHAAACVVATIGMVGLPETKPRDPGVSLRPQLGIPPAARPEFARVLAPASIWVFGFPSVSFALFPIILREAIGGAEVLIAGVVGSLTALAVLFSRPIIVRIGDARRALPVAMSIGIGGYLVGIVAFTTDAWWLAPVAAIAMGSASGILMSSGLAITEEIASDDNRGALSSTFYLAAYSGMTMPLIITGLSNLSSTTWALVVVTAAAVVALGAVVVGARDYR